MGEEAISQQTIIYDRLWVFDISYTIFPFKKLKKETK
jgi:hypothetical protein